MSGTNWRCPPALLLGLLYEEGKRSGCCCVDSNQIRAVSSWPAISTMKYIWYVRYYILYQKDVDLDRTLDGGAMLARKGVGRDRSEEDVTGPTDLLLI
jgi:hypothetical protein